MEDIRIKKISFTSFMKLNLLGAFSFGIMTGIFAFLLCITESDIVNVTINGEVVTGFNGGIQAIIMFPLVTTIVFTIFSLFIYLGLWTFLKMKKNINIEVERED